MKGRMKESRAPHWGTEKEAERNQGEPEGAPLLLGACPVAAPRADLCSCSLVRGLMWRLTKALRQDQDL